MRVPALKGLRYLIGMALLLQGVKGVCSAPPPVLRGAVSANGRVMVACTFDLGDEAKGGGRPVRGQAFEVSSLVDFRLDARDRLSAGNSYFGEPAWTVKVDRRNTPEYWPIISNDGSTLVLVAVSGAGPQGSVLKIYRRDGAAGLLVRSFALGELWSDREIHPHGDKIMMFTDASPLWFAGGRFAFSMDGESLIYTHAGGVTNVISVRSGAMTRHERGAAGEKRRLR